MKMTPKFLSDFCSEVQSLVPTWMFNRYLWPKLLLRQFSLSVIAIPFSVFFREKNLKIIFFPPLSPTQCIHSIDKYCQLHRQDVLHFTLLTPASSRPAPARSHLDYRNSLTAQLQSVCHTATEAVLLKYKSNHFILIVKILYGFSITLRAKIQSPYHVRMRSCMMRPLLISSTSPTCSLLHLFPPTVAFLCYLQHLKFVSDAIVLGFNYNNSISFIELLLQVSQSIRYFTYIIFHPNHYPST